jgi:MFS family permease
MALSQDVTLFTAGRVLSGIGAVFLNVLVTKMVTDWFQGKEVATALGVVSSWPLGIAIALIVVPPLAAGSWAAGMWMAAGLSCLALLLVVAVYRSPPGLLHAAAGRLTFNLTCTRNRAVRPERFRVGVLQYGLHPAAHLRPRLAD